MNKNKINLIDIIKNDSFLQENETKVVAVLRALSLSITNIDKNMSEIVPRVAFKTRTTNAFVKKVIKSMPGEKVDFAIKSRYSQILSLHRKHVSIETNKKLQKYFSSIEFLAKKESMQIEEIKHISYTQKALNNYFQSEEFLAHKTAINSK